MLDLFLYNWQVRDDWFKWCEALSEEELRKERIGGVGSILKNLYHVIDCERLWVHHMQNKPVISTDLSSISSLDEVMAYAKETRANTEEFLKHWTSEDEEKRLELTNNKGVSYSFTYKKVLLHIITHEVHHIGQLSIWSRELGMKPISTDLIFRDYM
ncbi:MAG: DinB family protein [Bacillaceae bacterium]|nr:DinB family protein [Bacillaceae bacterium]